MTPVSSLWGPLSTTLRQKSLHSLHIFAVESHSDLQVFTQIFNKNLTVLAPTVYSSRFLITSKMTTYMWTFATFDQFSAEIL